MLNKLRNQYSRTKERGRSNMIKDNFGRRKEGREKMKKRWLNVI